MKKEILKRVEEDLEGYFYGLKRIGSKFYATGCRGCVLRDVIARIRRESGIDIDLYLTAHPDHRFYASKTDYFVGGEDAAKALQEAFGGLARRSDTSDPKLWVWDASQARPHISFDDVMDVII